MSISLMCPFVQDNAYLHKLDLLLESLAHRVEKAYKLQQLVYHLQCIPSIVETVPAEELFQLTDDEFAAHLGSGGIDIKGYNAELEAFATQQSVISCKRCGVGEVDWFTVQTRSADEASTVFCVCRGCSARWRM